MTVHTEKILLADLSVNKALLPRETHAPDRSYSKPHVSTLLRNIGNDIGAINYAETGPDASNSLVMAVGLAWEDWYACYLHTHENENFVYHPGELELDGIVGNPDGYHVSRSGELILDEFKTTWKGPRGRWEGGPDNLKPLQSEWYWLSQCRAYCRMLETNRAVLHVLHMRPHGDEFATLLRHHIEYSDKEIAGQWAVMRKAAEQWAKDRERD